MITIEQMVQREVNCCLSSLVSTLAKGDFHRRTGQNGELVDLCEQAAELAAPVDDWEEAATQDGWTGPHTDEFGATYFRNETENEQNQTWCAKDWATLCFDFDIDPYQWEVFEHWAVSTWLAEKLIAQGEKVDTDFASMNVWARTTTGQGIANDSCIKKIYAELIR